MRLTVYAVSLAVALTSSPTLAQTQGNQGLCNRIAILCGGPNYAGFESFAACWADNGAEVCPPWVDKPTIPLDPPLPPGHWYPNATATGALDQ